MQARPCPTFGRPVHHRGGPHRLRPGTSPHALRIPPRGGHPALRRLQVRWLQVRLGCVRLSPSCPFRLLHTFHLLRPARRYPRVWIWRPSSERQRDLNPPEQRAAQRTLRARPSPPSARPVRHRSPVGRPRPRQGASRVARAFLVYVLSPLPRHSHWRYCLAHPSSGISLPRKGRRVGLCIFLFEAYSAFTRVTARTLALPPVRGTLTRRLQPYRCLHELAPEKWTPRGLLFLTLWRTYEGRTRSAVHA